MRSLIRILINDEGGATAIEYSLIVAAIAGVIIVVVLAIGTKVQGLYQQADDGFPQP
ncbi:MAG: pilin [Deltaproteobacteria bacterium RIFOXYA12_FULL_58_15]|nr:MAG: pilin [Deltaproteobacteria bacterium RIFOXYA12_FULL_58_15]OGR15238.1 MAG: pilin [Deltaproteobacteria bacterium RIFOXYB12_FULL_58_9]